MVSAIKSSSATPTTARRKSTKNSLIIKLNLPPEALKKYAVVPGKEGSPLKDSSSTTSNTLPVASSSNGDNLLDSTSNTPVASGTPVPSSMPPPTEGVKKKGVKRSSTVALGPDGLPIPKVRGKPGPKKKARLEDGTIDHSSSNPKPVVGAAVHKLGPKANQGAINAGLRALDRSGKPCRKWQRGSFKIKSFTGVTWELPRWTAPSRPIVVLGNSEGSASGESSKENKDSSQIASEKSNSGPDVDITSLDDQKVVSTAPLSIPTIAPVGTAPS